MAKDTNKVHLIGTLEAPFKIDHCVREKRYYSSILLVQRVSGKAFDRIPVCIEESKLKNLPFSVYDIKVEIEGYIVTARKEWGKLLVSVRITSIVPVVEYVCDLNEVNLSGSIAKKPVFRVTPSNIPITDMYIISEREHGNTSYIPAIAWNDKAYFARKFDKGTKIFVSAFFQSRKYKKIYVDGSEEEKETYELSIFALNALQMQ